MSITSCLPRKFDACAVIMRLQLFNLYKSYASYISLGNIVIFLIACGLLIFGITIYISIQNDAALLQ